MTTASSSFPPLVVAFLATLLLCSGGGFLAPALAEEATAQQQQQQQQQQPIRRTRNAQKQPEAYQQNLVDWLLEDPDAYFHPGILWKRLGPDGASGPYAFHATEDIPKGTPLIVLPRRYFLESGLRSAALYPHENDPRLCTTVRIMLEEYEKVKNRNSSNSDNSNSNDSEGSFYEPYLSYLFDGTVGGTSSGLLPTSWSHPASDILDRILGNKEGGEPNDLEPRDYVFDNIVDYCEDIEKEKGGGHHVILGLLLGDKDNNYEYEFDEDNIDHQLADRHAQDAFLFVKSRAWFDKLLPIVDFFNHANGPARNVEITPVDDSTEDKYEDAAAYTSRDVLAGEQLQYSYSECFDLTCEFTFVKYFYHTQTIFTEYGFVERYPQRWTLGNESRVDEDEYHLTAEVTIDEKTGELVLRWIFETPDDEGLRWIQAQLDRLRSIESEVREGVASIPAKVREMFGSLETLFNVEHEQETILELYEGYVRVLTLALKHKDDPVFITREEHRRNVQEKIRNQRQLTIEDIRNHELLKKQPESENAHPQAQAQETETETETAMHNNPGGGDEL